MLLLGANRNIRRIKYTECLFNCGKSVQKFDKNNQKEIEVTYSVKKDKHSF